MESINNTIDSKFKNQNLTQNKPQLIDFSKFLNQDVLISMGLRTFSGKLTKIDDSGNLLLHSVIEKLFFGNIIIKNRSTYALCRIQHITSCMLSPKKSNKIKHLKKKINKD